jgi:hypothetical protein
MATEYISRLLERPEVMKVLSELGGEYIFKRPAVFKCLRDLYQGENRFIPKDVIVNKIGNYEVDQLLSREILEESQGYIRLTGFGEFQLGFLLNLISAIKRNNFPPTMSEDQRKELSLYVKYILE